MTIANDYSHLFPDLAEREQAARLLEASHAARRAFVDYPFNPVADYEGCPVRCAASGIPIMVDDEYVEDAVTGELWLRAVIGLGPRELDDDDVELGDSELETESA